MLALRPDLVGTSRPEADYPSADVHLEQPDLTMVGVGHFSPSGVIGWSGAASAGKGAQLVASIRRNAGRYVRDRIQRLRGGPRYARPGGLAMRPLLPVDLPEAVKLSETAGWNQTAEDRLRILEVADGGAMAVVHQGRTVATTVAVRYGADTGFVAMVLVAPELRRMGLATRLIDAALERLAGCRRVLLDDTDAGRSVYLPRGFVDAGIRIVRFVNPAVSPPPGAAEPAGRVIPLQPADYGEAFDLDRQALGTDREPVLVRLARAYPERAWQLRSDGRLVGFCLGHPGRLYDQIGPVVAPPPSATALLTTAACALTGGPVCVDLPDHSALAGPARRLGFSPRRSFVRMLHGAGLPTDWTLLQAVAGPELG